MRQSSLHASDIVLTYRISCRNLLRRIQDGAAVGHVLPDHNSCSNASVHAQIDSPQPGIVTLLSCDWNVRVDPMLLTRVYLDQRNIHVSSGL